MIGELSVLSEWIPEQMEPGTIFVLENAGEIGDKEDPFWAVLSCPDCGAPARLTSGDEIILEQIEMEVA